MIHPGCPAPLASKPAPQMYSVLRRITTLLHESHVNLTGCMGQPSIDQLKIHCSSMDTASIVHCSIAHTTISPNLGPIQQCSYTIQKINTRHIMAPKLHSRSQNGAAGRMSVHAAGNSTKRKHGHGHTGAPDVLSDP